MSKKGFTLVELLAVIVIVSLLAVLASTSVTKVVTNSKSELYNTQLTLIKDAAEAWGVDNLNRLPSENGACKYLRLGELKRYGLLDSSIKNPKTNKEFSDDMNIKVTSNVNAYGDIVIEYEVDPDDISSCTPMYICKLVSDADNSNTITPGDKYQCKVKNDMEEGFEDGYYFYVLSSEEDGTTNLIMERNIYYDEINDVGKVATETNKGLVAWYALEDDSSYGPVKAMDYLHKATKDWDNVPNMIMNYEDQNLYRIKSNGEIWKGPFGYGSIVTTGTTTIITSKNEEETGRIENLKARMPRYVEVYGRDDKCLPPSDAGGNFGSCPLWLVNYMETTVQYSTTNGKVEISGINGYWTLTSYHDIDIPDRHVSSWIVGYRGELHSDEVTVGAVDGVRPVINLKL